MSLSKVENVATQADVIGDSSSIDSSGLPFGLSNWQLALLIGTPIIIGGVAYWYLSSSENPSTKGRGKKKATKTAKIKPSPRSTNGSSPVTNSTPKKVEKPHVQAKIEGNTFFQKKNYEKAIEMYSEAIKLCPPEAKEDLATFYQNRAAAKEMLGRIDEVIEDCDKAISLKKDYLKAIQRRAKAHEKRNNLQAALIDATATCILEQFSNESNLIMTDRILKRLSKEKAKDFMSSKRLKPPSDSFIRQYFLSFANDPIFPMVDGKQPVVTMDKLKSQLITLTLNNPNVDDDPRINLLNGTLHILLGNVHEAETFLQRVVTVTLEMVPQINEEQFKSLRSNAMTKLASLQVNSISSPNVSTEEVDQSLFENALITFQQAIDLDPNNPDIYIHRAQVYILMSRTEEANRDLEKCLELKPNFTSALAQKLYLELTLAMKEGKRTLWEKAKRKFMDAIEKNPDTADLPSLFGQALADAEMYQEADDQFVKAIKADSTDANEASIRMGDQFSAIKFFEKATEVDPRCQFAYEMWGTLEVQAGNLKKGIELFEQGLDCVNTEFDYAHLFSLKTAAESQLEAASMLGMTPPDVQKS